mgnify:CR=1 FL=1
MGYELSGFQLSLRRGIGVGLLLGLLLLSGCSSIQVAMAPEPEKVELTDDGKFATSDGKAFGFQQWGARLDDEGAEPDLVVIGVHGINGASDDWHVLGRHLGENKSNFALYAYDLRGMGRDPVEPDRGDLRRAEDWTQDLLDFTRLVRLEHPKAKLVWFGESLGSLIVMRTVSELEGQALPVDAIGLSAPIAGFGDKLSWGKKFFLRGVACLFPRWRISMMSLSGGEEVEVVEGVKHDEQAVHNDWNIERHTLRLLVHIGDQVKRMNHDATLIKVPTLVMHGGNDVFTDPQTVRDFFDQIPEGVDKKLKFYPESYHLLFYDKNNEVICRDVIEWLEGL